MTIESLESRQLLAVDGVRIDLGGEGGTNLLGPTGGGSVHEGYLNGPIGLTLSTGNVPGQNNELPIAGPDSHEMGQNDSVVELLTAMLISNDSDPDSTDSLTFSGIDAGNTIGTVTYDEANHKVIYAPQGPLNYLAAGQTVTDTFTYTVTDAQGGTGTGIVTITINGVNDAPSFTPGPDVAVDEDAGSQTFANWATDITDGDSETDELTFEIVHNTNPGLFLVTPTIDAAGNLAFTPADQAFGEAHVSVRIDDGQATNHHSAIETFAITIHSVNDAPTFDLIETVEADIHDGGHAAHNIISQLATGPDNESDQAVDVALTFNSNPDLFAVPPSIDGFGNLTFTPAATGTATLTVAATDDGGTDRGGVDSATKQLVIQITEANRPPILNPIGISTGVEGVQIAFTADALDINGDRLSYYLVGAPEGAAIHPDGEFSWIPSETQGGQAFEFDLVVTDGEFTDSETLVISVGEVNVAPIFDPLGDQSVDEHDTLSLTVTAQDTDLPANTLQYSLTGTVPQGARITEQGQFSWTPAESQGAGTYELDVRVTDGELSVTKRLTIHVAEVNEAPILNAIGDRVVDEGVQLSFTASATDADLPADSLLFSLSGTVPEGAIITSAGEFSWTPTELQGGETYTLVVQVSDGSSTDSETIQITVNEVNSVPILNAIGNQTVNENEMLSFIATASDPDVPNDELVFGLSGEVPLGATIKANGQFSWMPTESQGAGSYTFNVTVSDGTTTVAEEIFVTVHEVNDAPTFTVLDTHVVADLNDGERTVAGFVHDVEAGPAGEPIQSVTVSVTDNSNPEIFASGPALDAAGNLTFVPAAVGSATVTLTATDDGPVGNGDVNTSAPIQFTITISETMRNKYPIDGIVDFSGLETRTESLNFGDSGTSSSVTIGFDNDDRDLYVALQWADSSFDNQWYLDGSTNYDEIVLQIDGNGNNQIDSGEDYRWVRATNTGSFFRDAHFDGEKEQDDLVGDGLAKLRYDSTGGVYQAEFLIPLADDLYEQDSAIGITSRYQLIVRDGYQPYEGILNQATVFTDSELPVIPVQETTVSFDHPEIPADLTGLIVFVSSHEEPNGEIYTFDPATGETFRVTNNTLAENSVSLSRDRTKIAFDAFIDPSDPTSLEIFSVNVDGTQLRQLTSDANANAHPAWSPDGTRLSYSRIFPGSPGITIISETGQFIQDLTPAGIEDHDAEYLPDGRIVFKTNRWSNSPQYLTGIMNEDGTNVQQLTFVNNVSDHDQFGNEEAVIFERFPKGTNYETDPQGVTLGWNLIEVPLDGSGERTLLADGWMNTTPVYDPSGRYILYMKGPAYFEASLMTREGKVLGRLIPDVTQISFIDWR